MDVKNVFHLNVKDGTYTIPLNTVYNYVYITHDNTPPVVPSPVIYIVPDPNDIPVEGIIIKGVFQVFSSNAEVHLFGVKLGFGYVAGNIPYKFEAIYLNGTWNLTIHPSLHVAVSVLNFDVSFDTGTQTNYWRYLPIARGNIVGVFAEVTSVISGTDDGIIDIGISSQYGSTMGGNVKQIIVPESSHEGSIVAADITPVPISFAQGLGGIWVYCSTNKPTPGGHVHITILCKE